MRKMMWCAVILAAVLFFSGWAYFNHCSSYANMQFDNLKAVVTEQYRPGYLSAYSGTQLSKETSLS